GTVLGVDLVDERLEMAQRHGVDTLDLRTVKDVGDAVRERTDGRGADAVIDAVGMEAHGAPVSTLVQQFATLLPDRIAEKAFATAGLDGMSALYTAIDAVRRGGPVSLSGVYGGMAVPMPMMTLFDK